METVNLILTKFTDEAITFSVFLLLILICLVIVLWIYNRKKFHKLTHQIPASVIKNYLDSIIQNSTALKSSLFRGGGLEIGEGIPFVKPLDEMPKAPVEKGPSSEELNQKNAEIASLRNKLTEKENVIVDLEKRLKELEAQPKGGDEKELVKLREENGSLKEQLKQALESGGEGLAEMQADLETKLETVTKERDELKERLMEYEIIEEDLANLKRLQQENVQLKKTIEALKRGEEVPEEVPIEEPPAEEPPAEEPPTEEPPTEEAVTEEVIAEEAPVEEVAVEEAPVETEEAPVEEEKVEAAASDEEAPEEGEEEEEEGEEGDQKSAEELLSEFEKMLG